MMLIWPSQIEGKTVDLDAFSIYKPNEGRHPNEFAPLHDLCPKASYQNYYLFDGFLRDGYGKRYYVQKVPFRLRSIGGYCNTAQHSVGDQIWIESMAPKPSRIWYRLCRPAPEYERYHTQFVWLANFSKYFADFLSRHEDVRIRHFRSAFHLELLALHGTDVDFKSWLHEYGDTDFRRVVAAHPVFLYNEAVVIAWSMSKKPIWAEVHPKSLAAVPAREVKETLTVVTPLVYECFKDMPWKNFLKPVEPVATGYETLSAKRVTANIAEPRDRNKTALSRLIRDERRGVQRTFPGPILVGDVVAVEKDVNTIWKSVEALWFAYVQDVRRSASGRRNLMVVWLYAPTDTSCSGEGYPIQNELFFSDNCNCGNAALDAEDVVCKVAVGFFRGPNEPDVDFIVRQKYRTNDAAFVSLRQDDFRCTHYASTSGTHSDQVRQKYRVGDAVLYLKPLPVRGSILEPAEIVDLPPPGLCGCLLVRRLLRRKRDFPNEEKARPNELVYTDDIFALPPNKMERKCHIRFYAEAERRYGLIPAPYDRDGAGDAYYITCRQVGEGSNRRLVPLTTPFPPSLRQGFDPLAPPPRRVLSGMDLFCGGGNFGRGLEDGGAVRNRWAVDYNKCAIHTYHANLKRPDGTALYYGSVDDFLLQALEGRYSAHVPRPGQVDLISAGSPCQGFSHVNPRKTDDRSLKNSSLVASVAAFIDFYRPKYAVLENVIAMANKRKGQEHNVFLRLLSALVAMGYQVQQFYLDAWSFGNPQSRARLFVSIAAPGLELPRHPAQSHSHPPGTREAGLGVTSNRASFGARRFRPTPFKFVSAAEGTRDLPWIGDSRTQTCIPHPDHRTARFELYRHRAQISQVPIAPRLQGFLAAFRRGRLGQPQIEAFPWKNKHKTREDSRAWQRLHPDRPIPAVTTTMTPGCSFTGMVVHWEQHRLLTVMEVRRAQGFPDRDVLIGSSPSQWKMVGNSVARGVALALGMSLREAWLANAEDGSRGWESSEPILRPDGLTSGVAKTLHTARASRINSGSEQTLGKRYLASAVASEDRRAKRLRFQDWCRWNGLSRVYGGRSDAGIPTPASRQQSTRAAFSAVRAAGPVLGPPFYVAIPRPRPVAGSMGPQSRAATAVFNTRSTRVGPNLRTTATTTTTTTTPSNTWASGPFSKIGATSAVIEISDDDDDEDSAMADGAAISISSRDTPDTIDSSTTAPGAAMSISPSPTPARCSISASRPFCRAGANSAVIEISDDDDEDSAMADGAAISISSRDTPDTIDSSTTAPGAAMSISPSPTPARCSISASRPFCRAGANSAVIEISDDDDEDSAMADGAAISISSRDTPDTIDSSTIAPGAAMSISPSPTPASPERENPAPASVNLLDAASDDRGPESGSGGSPFMRKSLLVAALSRPRLDA